MQERRLPVRWQVNRPISIMLSGQDVMLGCHAEDVSYKGIRIRSPEPLFAEDNITLDIALDDKTILDDIGASVVWKRVSENYNIYGLYFNKINEKNKERIHQFVQQYCPRQITKHLWQGLS